jgi:DNA-binding NtrC family response regulator
MMIGESAPLRALLGHLHRFASCGAAVLLEGETGTGKELAAREIHYMGARRDKPFVPVNCGALPDSLLESELFGHCRGAFTDARSRQPGLVEHAHGGTLFLDEVDSLTPKAQVALLRFLQDSSYRPVGAGAACTADVRLVAATNAHLDTLVGQGAFRRDLFYRLNVLYAMVPALRERGGDVVRLAGHFLAETARRMQSAPKRWAPEALDLIVDYAWPGNIRELENVVLRAFLQADGSEVGVDDLVEVAPVLAAGDRVPAMAGGGHEDVSFSMAKMQAVSGFEKGYLTRLLRHANGNISVAARLSGTERRQLGKLLKKHNIQAKPFRP